MAPFNSIEAALCNWFDKPLNELPEEQYERVRKEFLPLPWDELSPSQRRSYAAQWDYQNDPSTEAERQYWWDFGERQRGLEAQIAEWEATATPTASDLALKENRLQELHTELAAMKRQERMAGGGLAAAPHARLGEQDSGAVISERTTTEYVAYPKAMRRLKVRLGASPQELAAWIFYQPEQGGIAAYLNANELKPPPRFKFVTGDESDDYVAPLMRCWFAVEDVETFQPQERYMTGHQLMERWRLRGIENPREFVRAKIHESRLGDMHPYMGLTEGSVTKELTDLPMPPIESGLFAMSEIRQIEAEDFEEGEEIDEPAFEAPVAVAEPNAVVPVRSARREVQKQKTQKMRHAWAAELRRLKKKFPGRHVTFYAAQISRGKLAEGRSAETIRKALREQKKSGRI